MIFNEKANAIVGQSGGPTTAINATLAGVISAAISSDKIDVIYGARNGVEGMLRDDKINLSEIFDCEEKEDKLARLSATPSAALGSCRLKLPAVEGAESNEKYIKLFKTEYFLIIPVIIVLNFFIRIILLFNGVDFMPTL